MNNEVKSRIIAGIALISVLSYLLWYAIRPHQLWWDEAVYVLMGKYLFSGGSFGLWEGARPLVMPLLLGAIWKAGFPVIITGKIAASLISLCIVAVVFLLAEEWFGKPQAILAALFLLTSWPFLFFGSTLMTEHLSMLFSLIAVWLFLKKRWFFAGFFLGMGFATRFTQVFIAASLGALALLAWHRKKASTKNLIAACVGLLLPLFPYLMVNALLYQNPLYPFFYQIEITQTTSWPYIEPFWFYAKEIILLTPLYLFALLGFGASFWKAKKEASKYRVIALITAVLFTAYSLIGHKEVRFATQLLPYLSILSAHGITIAYSTIQKRGAAKISFVVVIFIFWIPVADDILLVRGHQQDYSAYWEYIHEKGNITDGLWISNPLYMLEGEAKADRLMYYPRLDSERIETLTQEIPQAKTVFISLCDMPCPPNDFSCPAKKKGLLESLKESAKAIREIGEEPCRGYIIERQLALPHLDKIPYGK
ncbi:TPA: hypothetical protein HA270_02670 [Candidatus Woesearchaeota archaeon]|nr:hypothetical protein [Candidatus Woesearchaeota archaeon]